MAHKSAEPVLHALVAEGLAIMAKMKAKEDEKAEKLKEVVPIDEALKTLNDELKAVNDRLIEVGAGRYCNETGHVATVVPELAATVQPDRYVLPEGGLPAARELAGDAFRKLFDRTEIFTPRNGFDAIADILLTPKKAREIVAMCLVPGQPKGGRVAHVRWNK